MFITLVGAKNFTIQSYLWVPKVIVLQFYDDDLVKMTRTVSCLPVELQNTFHHKKTLLTPPGWLVVYIIINSIEVSRLFSSNSVVHWYA